VLALVVVLSMEVPLITTDELGIFRTQPLPQPGESRSEGGRGSQIGGPTLEGSLRFNVLLGPGNPVVVDPKLNYTGGSRLWIRINDGWHGFFSQMTVVLNSLSYAEKNKFIPYVFIGKDTMRHGRNRYFDHSVGPNIWEYFFLPVSPTLPPISPSERERDKFFSWHEERNIHNAPEAIKAYYYGHSFDDQSNRDRFKQNKYDEGFYWHHRSRASHLISKYFRFRKEVWGEANLYFNEHFKGYKVLGVHMRGTDKIERAGGGRIIPAREYAEYANAYLTRYKGSRVFVATESKSLLAEFKGLVSDPGRVRSRMVLRSNSTFKRKGQTLEQNIFLDLKTGSGYRKGLDVVLDVILLSRCDYLVHGASAVSEGAIWFDIRLHNRSVHIQYERSTRQCPPWF